MRYHLFLDDVRTPVVAQTRPDDLFPGEEAYGKVGVASDVPVVICRTSRQAIAIVKKMGPPEHMYLDHDLGITASMRFDTAMDFLSWFCTRWPYRANYYDEDDNCLRQLETTWSLHSANSEAKANMQAYLASWVKAE